LHINRRLHKNQSQLLCRLASASFRLAHRAWRLLPQPGLPALFDEPIKKVYKPLCGLNPALLSLKSRVRYSFALGGFVEPTQGGIRLDEFADAVGHVVSLSAGQLPLSWIVFPSVLPTSTVLF
jgi:hypothetical protein